MLPAYILNSRDLNICDKILWIHEFIFTQYVIQIIFSRNFCIFYFPKISHFFGGTDWGEISRKKRKFSHAKMRKWSEKVARKIFFCKKCEIFAKRFFLSAGNPSIDTCIDFLTLQGSYLSTLLFLLMMFFFRVGRAWIILLSCLILRFQPGKVQLILYIWRLQSLLPYFRCEHISKSLLVSYLWFLPFLP